IVRSKTLPSNSSQPATSPLSSISAYQDGTQLKPTLRLADLGWTSGDLVHKINAFFFIREKPFSGIRNRDRQRLREGHQWNTTWFISLESTEISIFLQSRIGRDDTQDLFDTDIHAGLEDFWQRFQLPFATAPETIHLDEQVIKGTVEELLPFNGWAAAACTTLTRPYASDSEDPYADLTKPGQRYFFALVVHSADQFFIDQPAVVVQAARKLGTQAIFVSVVDYASTDSIPFLCDLAEAVMVLHGIPFRIRRVPPMTSDPAASYYPLEEAYTRNLALEPSYEGPCMDSSQMHFCRDIWRMSAKEGVKEAARDTKQRDKAGKPRGLSRELEDLIRVVAPRLSIPVEELPQPTRSSPPSKSKEEHEKHVEDKQDGVGAGRDLAANEEKEAAKKKEQEDAGEQPLVVDEKSVGGKPLPKGQQKFKRDELVQPPVEQTTPEQDQSSAKVKSTEDSTQSPPSDNQIKQGDPIQTEKKVPIPVEEEYVYEEEEEEEETGVLSQTSTIPNSAFKPARILVNPRCITTYAGVSHTKLALDLFGSGDDVEPSRETGGKYHFSEEKFIGAPNAFVCQEMRTTGGRLSPKQQRRTNFHISKTLRAGWRPGDYV
ncbi:hypothetical protein MJO29_000374, partial [Puccinia striiformis f. sp. tritici]